MKSPTLKNCQKRNCPHAAALCTVFKSRLVHQIELFIKPELSHVFHGWLILKIKTAFQDTVCDQNKEKVAKKNSFI